jgi:hypothetical protein
VTARDSATLIGEAVWRYYRKRAIAHVAAAVKYGQLPSLRDVATPCVHCGERASIYEHRDYTDPLSVVPACDPCNQKIGPAALSTETVIDHLRHSERFPYKRGAKRL